ncbi:MAG: Txe/YoeB family addiction module toxin [Flavobacteriaceae bacterium]|nr:MAG: Txe/YoeB family addiction module toxin [Flavobacteriaceae bacterium]
MEIEFSDQALKDLKYWKKTRNLKTQRRISDLLIAITASPFEGVGNPEKLKHQLTGYWSRKITKEHRIVYLPMIEKNTIIVISLRFHYS